MNKTITEIKNEIKDILGLKAFDKIEGIKYTKGIIPELGKIYFNTTNLTNLINIYNKLTDSNLELITEHYTTNLDNFSCEHNYYGQSK